MSRDPSVSRRQLMSMAGVAGASALLAKPHRLFGLKEHLLSATNPIARRFGTYTAYQLSREEYVGTVVPTDGDLDLDEAGYRHNPLSAVKYHPDTREPDDSTWRRIDEENPRWQYHVHTWEINGAVEVFSHYEYRPDPHPLAGETPPDTLQRLRDHYNPKWDVDHDDGEANYFLGATEPRLRAFLDG